MLPRRGDGGDRPSRRPRGGGREVAARARDAGVRVPSKDGDDVVLEARALTKHFPVTRGRS